MSKKEHLIVMILKTIMKKLKIRDSILDLISQRIYTLNKTNNSEYYFKSG